jgi:hypothetical protein
MHFLLKHLWSWLLFSGTMFFAAGAVADPGAISGADEAGVDDAGADDSLNADAGTDDAAGADDSANADANTDKNDGRTLPKNIQSALKTLAEAHPELKKDLEELRKGYFGHRQHSEFFKSPGEARQAKAALDLVGGHEGIANLQSQVAAIEMVDGALESGDPQVLDDMFADFGEGMKKLAGPYLERLEKLDPQAAFSVTQPYAYKMLESAELGPRLNEIFAAIGANKLDDAKTIVTNIYRWLEGQKQQAGNRAKEPDPERAKFETERKQFNETKEKTFREDIGRQTVAHQSSQIDRSLSPYLKTKNLSADAKSDLVDGVNREINRVLKADKTYQDQVKALLSGRKRDAGNIVRYINSVVAEVAPKAVKAVWGRRYGTVAPPARAAAAAGADKNAQPKTNPAQSAPVKVAVKPKTSDIVKDRNWDINFMKNRALMATGPLKGKWVTW